MPSAWITHVKQYAKTHNISLHRVSRGDGPSSGRGGRLLPLVWHSGQA